MGKLAVNWVAISALLTSFAAASFGADTEHKAGEIKVDAKVEKNSDIRAELASKLPGAKPEDVHPTPVTGLYEIHLGSSTGYITADGKYLISGDLYEIASKTNITEGRRTALRLKEMANIKDSDAIVFAPNGPAKHTITVFTDMDCGYCRKLHSEIAQINKLGIRVRYVAYPRSGPGTESWFKAEAVWCSKDRRDALTRSKLGEDITASKCATPVANQYQLGERIGVNGTPAIFTENGEYISGYLPAAKLAAYLDELKQPGGVKDAAKEKPAADL